jgi:hypothetical protein
VLGFGLAAAVGLDPGLIFASYTIGLGVLLLGLDRRRPKRVGPAQCVTGARWCAG